MDISFIFAIIVLIFSVVVHEVSHGYAALLLGDHTAEYEGRLTLNPLKHIDPVGTIILPAIFLMLPGHFLFGWAKPVPYNPYNLRNQRWGEAIVAGAGPLTNILIALIFGLIMRFVIPAESVAGEILTLIVLTNLVLAFFNLIPIPPLDGSKILFSLFPLQLRNIRERLERFGFIAVLIFAIVLWQFLIPVIGWLFSLITGTTF